MTTRYLKKIDFSDESNNTFEKCKFDRKKYAQNLTKVIELYPSGFVMALNNEWGAGKTTFLNMWKKYLEENGFTAIYFNAWENDFDTSPLVAIISELQEKINKINEEIPKNLLKYGSLFAKNLIPEITKNIIKKYLHIDDGDIFEHIVKSSTEILDAEINNYTNRKQNIRRFKDELTKYIDSNIRKSSKPLIFIIDELDRCKPTYSVELLEVLKHFFSIDNVVFVLSIDKDQLSNSIKGYFGSENFDSVDYLRRFIDFEYSLPEPSKEAYIEYLTEYYELEPYFKSTENKTAQCAIRDFNDFNMISAIYLSNHSLRHIEKYFIHARIVFYTFPNNAILFPSLTFFLIYLKTFNKSIYNSIENKTISFDELSSVYCDLVKNKINAENEHLIVFTEAILIVFYDNLSERPKRFNLLQENGDGHLKPSYNSELSKFVNDKLESKLNLVLKNPEWSSINLKYYMNRINLINQINSP